MAEPEFLVATRAAYELVAEDYAEATRDGLAARPYDVALLSLFAELVRANRGGRGSGLVADIGCGAGHVVEHLRGLGLRPLGVDLSPRMLEQARRAHPHLEFRAGSILELPVTDRTLDGVVAQYSFNTVPPEVLPTAFAQLRRALVPGGVVLLAFAVRPEAAAMVTWFDRPVDLRLQRLVPDEVEQALRDAGLPVQARMVRDPLPHETSSHAYLIAARPRT